MNITVTAQGFELTSPIDEFVRRELDNALRRVNGDVVSIDVFLKDANGPKGGIDKQVVIRVRLRNRQLIAINTLHEDLYAAAKKGVQRTKRAVRRNHRRSRRIEKRGLRQLHDDTSLPLVPN